MIRVPHAHWEDEVGGGSGWFGGGVSLRLGRTVHGIYDFPLPKALVKTLVKNLVTNLGATCHNKQEVPVKCSRAVICSVRFTRIVRQYMPLKGL